MGSDILGPRRWSDLPDEYRTAIVAGYERVGRENFGCKAPLASYEAAFEAADPVIRFRRGGVYDIGGESRVPLGHALMANGVTIAPPDPTLN